MKCSFCSNSAEGRIEYPIGHIDLDIPDSRFRERILVIVGTMIPKLIIMPVCLECADKFEEDYITGGNHISITREGEDTDDSEWF